MMALAGRSCLILSLPLVVALPVPAAENALTFFDLPAGAAEKSLRMFSTQSGRQVGFPTDITRGVISRAVRGEFPPEKALALLLADTGLTAVQDPKTGAFAVRRTRPDESKNGQRAAPRATGGRPVNPILPAPVNRTPNP
jgi:hypothetical protein